MPFDGALAVVFDFLGYLFLQLPFFWFRSVRFQPLAVQHEGQHEPRTTVEEPRFSAAQSVLNEPGFSPRVLPCPSASSPSPTPPHPNQQWRSIYVRRSWSKRQHRTHRGEEPSCPP